MFKRVLLVLKNLRYKIMKIQNYLKITLQTLSVNTQQRKFIIYIAPMFYLMKTENVRYIILSNTTCETRLDLHDCQLWCGTLYDCYCDERDKWFGRVRDTFVRGCMIDYVTRHQKIFEETFQLGPCFKFKLNRQYRL